MLLVMSTDAIDAAAILRDIEQAEAERVRLADLSRRIGWDKSLQSRALAEGLLEAERSPGRGHPYTITRDDAVTLLLAAVLAFAAGVAIASMLRGLKAQGVTGDLAADVLRTTSPT
jgi:hypothetical protein